VTLKTVYGHDVKDLDTAIIVSSKEADRLRAVAREEDKVRKRYGLPPIMKDGYGE